MPVNMSYCRFQNTLEALRECYDALGKGAHPFKELGDEERRAAVNLVKMCANISVDFLDDAMVEK